jgi:hypothetical protein
MSTIEILSDVHRETPRTKRLRLSENYKVFVITNRYLEMNVNTYTLSIPDYNDIIMISFFLLGRHI